MKDLDEIIKRNAERRELDRMEQQDTEGLADAVRERTSARPPEDRQRQAEDDELRERLKRIGAL